MIKYSRNNVRLELKLPQDVSEMMLDTPNDKYSFIDLLNLVQNSSLYLENKHERVYIGLKQRRRIFNRDNNCCVECGNVNDLELHHIIPIKKGGSNDDDNLQVLCSVCHHRKHKKF